MEEHQGAAAPSQPFPTSLLRPDARWVDQLVFELGRPASLARCTAADLSAVLLALQALGYEPSRLDEGCGGRHGVAKVV